MVARRNLGKLYQEEFANYSKSKFIQDLFAGCTVAAVALPLALAFGVASGASAAAGLITAIVAGLIIGTLSGAPYQISGPTGAMSAILIGLVMKGGGSLDGVFIAGLLSGIFLLLIGIFKLGRFIAFVPATVITGFTSGIYVTIAVGQFDNFFGIKSAATNPSAMGKLLWYIHNMPLPNWNALSISVLVLLIMIFWPKKWGAKIPASLVSIIVATVVSVSFGLSIDTIGAIPKNLFLDDHLVFSNIQWGSIDQYIVPAMAIAALGAVESLLCGAVCSNMTGVRLGANQELIAQGLGNMLLPFLGGVPATAALARSSVGIKSGGQTRLVSIFHSLILLASMFLLGGIISKVPLAALAGVLFVTAWRMNEWNAIAFYFKKKFKTGILTFLLTLVATVTLDLTQAILIGSLLSALIFLNQVSEMDIVVQDVDRARLKQKGIEIQSDCKHTKIAYIYGPLFFAATGYFNEAFSHIGDTKYLVLSMRGVPFIDTSGIRALSVLSSKLHVNGGNIMLAGVTPKVKAMLERGGLIDAIGEENIFWSADQAIIAVSKIPQ